ncbi:MAG: RagB/SusD family nutrient uptake outer membrane protein [Dysgonamonadaceae bacterium]
MKFYNKYIIIAALFLGGLSFTSCSDFLTEKPDSSIGPEQVGDSDDAVDIWVTGVYNVWLNTAFLYDQFPLVLEKDNDYISGPDWSMAYLGAGNFQNSSSEVDAMWKNLYALVERSNLAIKYISAMSNATESYKNNALGELYFQKAFAYFLLTRAYGEIPLSDKAISDGGDANMPRQSISNVYTEITSLLEKAIPLMYTIDNKSYSAGHVSAGTAAGLLAKVYATMGSGSLSNAQMTIRSGAATSTNGDVTTLTYPVSKTFTKDVVAGYEAFNSQECYTKAAKWAKAVMDGEYGTYALLPYSSLWSKANRHASEFMFSIETVSNNANYHMGVGVYFNGVLNSSSRISTGHWLGNRYHWYCLFDANDYRIVTGVQHRFVYEYQASYNNGFYYPNTEEYTLKATGMDANGNKVADPVYPFNDGIQYGYNLGYECLAFTTKYQDVTDHTTINQDAPWPFLRYADVVLIYAEAQNELGNSSDAISALNLIRERSNATLAKTTGDGALTSQLAIRSAIFEERAKELACEGDRRWDLIRWGVYLQAMNAIGGYDESGVYKTRTAKNLLYPLPTTEVDNNSSITTNNPGWN